MKLPRLPFDVFAILIVNFTGALGFSLVIPLLVFLNTRFGGNAFIYGIVGSVYAFCSFIAAPFLGRWSDRYGRKPVILISQIGTLFGWVVLLADLFLPVTPLQKVSLPIIGTFTLTIPLIILFLARAIDGITAGDISAAQAYIADVSDEKERNASYGLLSVAANIGFVIGPGLAGILALTVLHEKLPVILAIVVSIVAIFFVGKFLPESHHAAKRESMHKASLWEACKNRSIFVMLAIYFTLYIGFSIFYTSFPLFAMGPMHWTIGKIGIFFSYLAIAMAIVQGPLLSFLSKKFSEGYLAIVGTIILGVNFLLLTSGSDILIFIAFTCFALGNGIMWPSILSLLSKVAGEFQGTVQGFASSAGSLSSIIGLLLGGYLFSIFGGNAFLFSAGFIFITLLGSRVLLAIDRQTDKNRVIL